MVRAAGTGDVPLTLSNDRPSVPEAIPRAVRCRGTLSVPGSG